MADMCEFGKMDVGDRGGEHEFQYEDGRGEIPTVGLTPSQTVGPFFAYGLTPGAYGYPLKDIHRADLLGEESGEKRVTISGYVFDGEGRPVHDAVVEILQADSQGKYAVSRRNDGFTGYGRVGTGANGSAEKGGDTRFLFHTLKPGSIGVDYSPFVTFAITMRGLLNHCITRMYFPQDDHEKDPVLMQVPEERRSTLIGQDLEDGHYRFDIHMQGEKETVFFDV